MAKILSLDVGEKRIGAAISDELKMIASPFTIFEPNDLEEIRKIVDLENIEKIIIGLPRNMDGSLGSQAELVEKFGKKLALIIKNVEIEYIDETATSIEASKRLKERGVDISKEKEEIDKESAVIILEDYLSNAK